jgi:hypothetical protein
MTSVYITGSELEAHNLLQRGKSWATGDSSPDKIVESADKILELAERIRKERAQYRPKPINPNLFETSPIDWDEN